MAKVNLKAAFMAGMGSPVSAQQVFTNRKDEVAAFEQALRAHRLWLEEAAVSPVLDRFQGRRNVLCYYGMGGIGKTTLSLELERRLHAEELECPTHDALALRMDLGETSATDIETLVLRLRAGLGQLGNRWLAFDVALACYWARAHPGEPLQAFLDSSPLLHRLAKRIGLGDQIQQNLSLVAPVDLGGLPGLAQKAVVAAYRTIKHKVQEERLLDNCALFAELIEADAEYESLSFYPYLLAWDLEQFAAQANSRQYVCVFLDTCEVLSSQKGRAVERYLQRLIYLMPNVLFIMTGRNRLDWADDIVGQELDFTGPVRWPNLHYDSSGEEPRQHLVGYLSDLDADYYLRKALVLEGEPAMSPEIRNRVINGAQGHPLYLDLSVSHYMERLAQGREPGPADFGGSFIAVAHRALRDLSADERKLVRTAALVGRFDASLLRAGQPGVADGIVARFLKRPFLELDDNYQYPYSLHAALREAISKGDSSAADGWSDRDRREVAGKILLGLGDCVTENADRSSVAMALELGIKLAAEHAIFEDWLTLASQRLVEAGQWNAINDWLRQNLEGGESLSQLRATIEAIVLRRTGRADDAIRRLDEVPATISSNDVGGQMARLHRAHALRNTGEYVQAARIYQQLRDGVFSQVARYWLSDHDFLVGRFSIALEQLTPQLNLSPGSEGEHLRLKGHILRVNARFSEAIDHYRQASRLACDHGLVAAEAKAATNIAQTACWTADSVTLGKATARARELLDLVSNPVEQVKLLAAEAAFLAINGSLDDALFAVDDTRKLADIIHYRGGHNLADVAAILAHVRAGNDHDAKSLLTNLTRRTQQSGGNYYWVPIATAWLKGPEFASHVMPEIDWLDTAEQVLPRWARVITQ